jgi:hypothetical protein
MTSKTDTNPIYREVQRFHQLWLWVIVLAISVLAIYGFIKQVITGEPFGNNPAPDAVMIVLLVIFGLGFPILFYVMNLTTEVRSDGLYHRFYPIHLSFRRIGLENIVKYEVVTYSPLREYGGWGIRYGGKGKAYNVYGNRGVQLELRNGNRLLIGSQKPEQLEEALNVAMRTIRQSPG